MLFRLHFSQTVDSVSSYCYLQQHSIVNSCNTVPVFRNTITVLKFSRWVIWTGQHIAPPDLPVFPLRWLSFWTELKTRRESPEFKKKKNKWSCWGQLIIVLTKCYSITFCHFNPSSCIKQRQDKIVTIWYMWSFDTKLTRNLSTETRLTAVTVEHCCKTI